METLRGALEATDWDALYEPHGEDIDGLTDCVSDYIGFCIENTIPTKEVRCYPNNKPWVTSNLKILLNEKKRAFRSGDRAELKRVQRELKHSIRESRDNYRRKLEHKLGDNNIRDVWRGMREITGFQRRGGGAAEWDRQRANELNMFFNRFNSNPSSTGSPSSASQSQYNNSPPPPTPTNTTTCWDPFSSPAPRTSSQPPQLFPTSDCRHLFAPLLSPPPPSPLLTSTSEPAIPPTPQSGLHITSSQVKRELERKAAGPDGLSPYVLKACSGQLCGVLQHLFNMSLRLQRVPVLWKTSCLVPVPKKGRPTALED
ncbi:uncharacterized protein LOC121631042 [Melanotaenia boesemani]|uniref:uncharacterized protein LOC121631042 n=1 Tax=Melanotaenia boesemani TaxID=1250792 RepID=UPI001C0577C3|nr:uncharacterized protein LOC121631042 [Melanotaenia boesemani]